MSVSQVTTEGKQPSGARSFSARGEEEEEEEEDTYGPLVLHRGIWQHEDKLSSKNSSQKTFSSNNKRFSENVSQVFSDITSEAQRQRPTLQALFPSFFSTNSSHSCSSPASPPPPPGGHASKGWRQKIEGAATVVKAGILESQRCRDFVRRCVARTLCKGSQKWLGP
jgi:hypothetical protein